jgi:chloramphenicol 3-O-phosphotransferase
MSEPPLLVIFAGPNGSGKSTITLGFQELPDFPSLYQMREFEGAIKPRPQKRASRSDEQCFRAGIHGLPQANYRGSMPRRGL